jgi:hypothetical protein
MKHVGRAALDALEDLIVAIRARPGLKEPRRGVFYRKGKAWLHFHEDPSGLYADLRKGTEWTRFRVSELDERNTLLAALEHSLDAEREVHLLKRFTSCRYAARGGTPPRESPRILRTGNPASVVA